MASIVVLVIVFVLDLISFALAIAAEITRNTGKVIKSDNELYCKYGNYAASMLGVFVILLLVASQLLLMSGRRCLCCSRGFGPGGGSRFWAMFLFITKSGTFIIASICLAAGSYVSAAHPDYMIVLEKQPSCGPPSMKGIFSAAAAFIGFTCIFSELYYLKYSKCSNSNQSTATGVPMSNL